MEDEDSDGKFRNPVSIPYATPEKAHTPGGSFWGITSLVVTFLATPGILRVFGFFDLPQVLSSFGFKISVSGSMIGFALAVTGLGYDHNQNFSLWSICINVVLLVISIAAWLILY